MIIIDKLPKTYKAGDNSEYDFLPTIEQLTDKINELIGDLVALDKHCAALEARYNEHTHNYYDFSEGGLALTLLTSKPLPPQSSKEVKEK